ncbi:MAG: hypothetical protein HOM82_03415 [Thaumarchaeota archaeon]|jgi:hypothetical protein|nr:hypothetical protein [Nitrososphaerota archaeon]MBT3743101.1 hypothetical protein [Nitrososphaerota archaeon]MBT4056704.1 hypothetical protein [Nitrososphaerota archaeon]MBT4175341.1 hypothetical protein [Nitrososphaerota archaeon]MBT4510021.1 hypothetical protein [Nitrososphaerota archaeon]
MQYTDEQIEKMLQLKESIVDKMAKHQEELDFLQKNLDILDVVLKGSSFTKASSLPRKSEPSVETIVEKKEPSVETIVEKKDTAESIQIKKNKDGEVIANAFVTPEKISIIMSEGIGLTDEIPPLRSFFIERIIGEMKKIDSADVKNGKIDQSSVIDCVINKNGPAIREIIIKNYRQKERLDEIINTATWSLTRMLENSAK